MAATVFESTGPFDRDRLREVEAYASGDYLRELMHGERDAAAIERMAPRIAAYTGLDPAEVRRLAGRDRHQHLPARTQPHPRHGGERL